MFSNHAKTQSFEYHRNEVCHKILDALYFHAKPVIRENTFGKMMEGIEGTTISNKFFPPLDVSDLATKFNETDIFIQDCCEFLELNKHIEPTEKRNDIITKLRFTKLGVDAFKSDYYLKQNKEAALLRQLQKSTISNNRLTPLIAALTLAVSIVTFINQKKQSTEVQVKAQQFQQQLQSIDSTRQTQTNALYLLLENAQKSFSKSVDTSKRKDTTH